MSTLRDEVPNWTWYDSNIEKCIKTASLMGEILWGFLYAWQ